MANQVSDIKVGIIGAGTMGEAFIAALIRSGIAPSSISVVVRRPERGDELVKRYSITVEPLEHSLATSDVVILGIKPQGLAELLPQVAPHIKPDSLVISLLAGKTISAIAAGLSGHKAIARVMPNTPTLIGKGMAGYSLSSGVTNSQRTFIEKLLAATGKAIEIQIRTYDMHARAEFGIAAHWKYKQGPENTDSSPEMLWLRQLHEWQK